MLVRVGVIAGVMMIAARPLELDLDTLERREWDAHHRRGDLAHVLAMLVREDIVVGGDVDESVGRPEAPRS